MRVYTIHDLANGKCAVKNDGTIEELKTVLALAFPDYKTKGTFAYYWRSEWGGTYYNKKLKPHLPFQSVKDFLSYSPEIDIVFEPILSNYDTNVCFESVVNDTLSDIQNKLIIKGKEYRRNNDVFHNFHEGMKITGQTREDIIWGFALKHFISIQDIKNDLKQGKIPTEEVLNEKYNDLITYLLIEKASIMDKIIR